MLLIVGFIFGILFVFCIVSIACVHDSAKTEIGRLSTDLYKVQHDIAALKIQMESNNSVIIKNVERIRALKHAVVARLDKLEPIKDNK